MARKPRTEATEKPAEKKPAAASKDTKGTAWLTEVVNKNLGTSYSSYQIRILIRKLVKAGTIDRGEGRYEFTGLKDPRVVAIVKAAKAGGIKEATDEKVEGAKKGRTKTEPAEKKPATRRRKPAPEPEPEDNDEDEDDDMDLDEL